MEDQIYNLLKSKEISNIQLAQQLAIGQKISFDYRKFMECFPSHIPIGHPTAQDTESHRINFKFTFTQPIVLSVGRKPVKSATIGLEYLGEYIGTILGFHNKNLVSLGTVYTEKLKPILFDDVIKTAKPVWDTVYFDRVKNFNKIIDKFHPNLCPYRISLWQRGFDEGGDWIWGELLNHQLRLDKLLDSDYIRFLKNYIDKKEDFKYNFVHNKIRYRLVGKSLPVTVEPIIPDEYRIDLFVSDETSIKGNLGSYTFRGTKQYILVNEKLALRIM